MEALRGLHCVLAGEAIGDEQDLTRLGDLRDLRRFVHHLLVERGAPGRVEDQHVMPAKSGGGECAARDLRGLFAGDDRQAIDLRGLRQHRELLHRGGTIDVQRRTHHALLIDCAQAHADAAGAGGLTRALQARHHDHVRRLAADAQPFGRAIAAERLNQMVMNDFDDLLAGFDCADHALADRLFAHAIDEFAHDGEGDVRFQQGDPNLAQRGFDIGRRQRTAPGEPVEYAGKAVCQRVKHRSSKPKSIATPPDDHVGRGTSPASRLR